MNCDRCHHSDEAHIKTRECGSLICAGRCVIPYCTCKEYRDPIKMIDEDAL